MGMWSFDAMKILVCGDGACLHFRDPQMREKAEKWFYFGLETKSGYESSVAQKWWEFDISCFGHRAIMNDVTAAIALEQYKKLPMYMEKRAAVHHYYNVKTSRISHGLICRFRFRRSAQHPIIFYHVQVNNGKRDQLAKVFKGK